MPTATINGFASGDRIDLQNLVYGAGDSASFDSSTHVLTVSDNGTPYRLTFDAAQDFSSTPFFVTSDIADSSLLVEVTCFVRGTMILTPDGELAIEDLAIGDLVATPSGAARPVKWIGRRAYDGRFIAGNRAVLPVCIKEGALADGVPTRDLSVSPGHALYFNGVLIRAEHLVNGATIVQEPAVERVEYFHIELETHDILVADGAPAESYADCDNRGKFHNAEFAVLYPDDVRPQWQYCAPLLDWEAPGLNAIRASLRECPIIAAPASAPPRTPQPQSPLCQPPPPPCQPPLPTATLPTATVPTAPGMAATPVPTAAMPSVLGISRSGRSGERCRGDDGDEYRQPPPGPFSRFKKAHIWPPSQRIDAKLVNRRRQSQRH